MARQNEVAHDLGYTFAQTPAALAELEREGKLVRIEGNADYEIANVSFALARPETKIFIERLASQYKEATGEKLVVTSLIRPASKQPGNSHELSVHPTGMAVDLRVSQRAESREWLESTLLSLEEQGLLDITREYRPPHYHVALFPEAYMAHVERLEAAELAAKVVVEPAEVFASVANTMVPVEEPVPPRNGGPPLWTVALGAALFAGLALRKRATEMRRD